MEHFHLRLSTICRYAGYSYPHYDPTTFAQHIAITTVLETAYILKPLDWDWGNDIAQMNYASGKYATCNHDYQDDLHFTLNPHPVIPRGGNPEGHSIITKTKSIGGNSHRYNSTPLKTSILSGPLANLRFPGSRKRTWDGCDGSIRSHSRLAVSMRHSLLNELDGITYINVAGVTEVFIGGEQLRRMGCGTVNRWVWEDMCLRPLAASSTIMRIPNVCLVIDAGIVSNGGIGTKNTTDRDAIKLDWADLRTRAQRQPAAAPPAMTPITLLNRIYTCTIMSGIAVPADGSAGPLDLCRGLLSGLVAHASLLFAGRMLHRDISTGNVMFSAAPIAIRVPVMGSAEGIPPRRLTALHGFLLDLDLTVQFNA
ncbi:hypothetical protein DFH27DRAFT_529469 [Peziza echinospora]|nr:hypothetical protein DFH27DRAFT_529469 [Peziza echinospora]